VELIALGTGTSQGVPLIGCRCAACQSSDSRDKRLRSSVHVRTDRVAIQVDVGPDFRTQCLVNDISNIDYVLFTHEHNDHVIGIDDLRAVNFIQRKSLPLYAEPRVIGEIKKRFHYAFAEERYPGVPDIRLHEMPLESFQLEDIRVTPLRIQHGTLPILGFRFNNMAYITDASAISTETLGKLQDLDVLIINALRHEPHYSHFNLQGALEQIRKIKPRSAYLTHISHMMGPVREWAEDLPAHVYPLEDNLHIKG